MLCLSVDGLGACLLDTFILMPAAAASRGRGARLARLKSCAALDTLHWFESESAASDDAADQALQELDGNRRPGPDAATVRRAVNACPSRLTRVVVGGYDVTQWYAPQPSPTSSTSSASTVGPGHFRSVSEPFPPGWLDEPPTPPTPAAALHPLTQL